MASVCSPSPRPRLACAPRSPSPRPEVRQGSSRRRWCASTRGSSRWRFARRPGPMRVRRSAGRESGRLRRRSWKRSGDFARAGRRWPRSPRGPGSPRPTWPGGCASCAWPYASWTWRGCSARNGSMPSVRPRAAPTAIWPRCAAGCPSWRRWRKSASRSRRAEAALALSDSCATVSRPFSPEAIMAGSGVNKVILVGNLGKDPEVRYTPSGQAVANFTIATNENWTDKQGQKQERTEWHRIVVWGKTAELCGEYLSKGRQVYIEGRLQTREWTNKEGAKQYTTEIVANQVLFLQGGERGQGRGAARSGAAPADDFGPPPAGMDEPQSGGGAKPA